LLHRPAADPADEGLQQRPVQQCRVVLPVGSGLRDEAGEEDEVVEVACGCPQFRAREPQPQVALDRLPQPGLGDACEVQRGDALPFFDAVAEPVRAPHVPVPLLGRSIEVAEGLQQVGEELRDSGVLQRQRTPVVARAVPDRGDALGDDGVDRADPGAGDHLGAALVGAELEQVLELQRHQRWQALDGEAGDVAERQLGGQCGQRRPSDLRPAVMVPVAQTAAADLIAAVREAAPASRREGEFRRRGGVLPDADALPPRVQAVEVGQVQVTQARESAGIPASADQARCHVQA
jgi:hypothetical protein